MERELKICENRGNFTNVVGSIIFVGAGASRCYAQYRDQWHEIQPGGKTWNLIFILLVGILFRIYEPVFCFQFFIIYLKFIYANIKKICFNFSNQKRAKQCIFHWVKIKVLLKSAFSRFRFLYQKFELNFLNLLWIFQLLAIIRSRLCSVK